MATTVIKNKFGRMAGWNNVTVRILGVDLVGILKIDYDDSTEKEVLYGAGGYPVGKGQGNYVANATMDIYKEEMDKLRARLAVGQTIADIEDFDVVVSVDYGERTVTDVIKNCSFMGTTRSLNQNDKSIVESVTLLPTHINWGSYGG
jgi:hypothetical protein